MIHDRHGPKFEKSLTVVPWMTVYFTRSSMALRFRLSPYCMSAKLLFHNNT